MQVRDLDARADTQWNQRLKDAGLRVTKQRLAVLEAIQRSPHADAESITLACRRSLANLTIQSVYVVLGDLTKAGLLRKIQTDGTIARYETRTDDNHHHAVCLNCGRIEDVDCAHGHAPCLEPAGTSTMRITVAEVIYRGVCQDCQMIEKY